MKTFTKHIFSILFWLLAISAVAQPVSKRDRVEALRVSFITQKVNFTAQEAQQFWPLYNEYNDKIEAHRKSFRQQYSKNVTLEFTNDKEAEQYLAAELNLKQKEYELYKEYYEKFKKVLPVKKVATLRRAEEEFKKELIKNIKGNSSE